MRYGSRSLGHRLGALELAGALALAGCALDLSALPPEGGGPGRLLCPPGLHDGNRDPSDGCEYVCTLTTPAAELCDGIDNDCDPETADGISDATFGEPCDGPDEDLCDEGTRLCVGARMVCEDLTDNSREVCDGIDNDCDGTVDDGAADARLLFVDGDADGWGAPGEGISRCTLVDGYAERTGDCDDANAGVNPGVTESCNGVDDNCDGLADEGAGCGCVGEPFGGRDYFFCNVSRAWTDARGDCGARGLTLVTVDDAAENAWLRGRMDSYIAGNWWIGLNDRDGENSWRWQSGSGAGYRNWLSGEPNDGNSIIVDEDCVEMQGSGLWNDDECTDTRPYVCER